VECLKNILNLSIIGAGAMGSAIASGVYLAQKNSQSLFSNPKKNLKIELSICNRSQEKLNI
jgi:pyrroline-5-carboxylate reductase